MKIVKRIGLLQRNVINNIWDYICKETVGIKSLKKRGFYICQFKDDSEQFLIVETGNLRYELCDFIIDQDRMWEEFKPIAKMVEPFSIYDLLDIKDIQEAIKDKLYEDFLYR
jgi:hypothetical protein